MKFTKLVFIFTSISTPDLEQIFKSGAFSYDFSPTNTASSFLMKESIAIHFKHLVDLDDAPDDSVQVNASDPEPAALIPAPLLELTAPHYDFNHHSYSIHSVTGDGETPVLNVDFSLQQYGLNIPEDADLNNAITHVENLLNTHSENPPTSPLFLEGEEGTYSPDFKPGDDINVGSEFGNAYVDAVLKLLTGFNPFDSSSFPGATLDLAHIPYSGQAIIEALLQNVHAHAGAIPHH